MTKDIGGTSRRTFLKATAATSLLPALSGFAATADQAEAQAWPENGTLIPDTGWRLWVDEKAAWKEDAIFLPEDVRLAKLPVNPPTGGWGALGDGGLPVTLPSTVEQHCWGKYGSRPYTPEEYRYAADDAIPQNGAYFGVSWWYRAIEIPASMQGKRIFLKVRGARLRAEVYLNRVLVGYSIMEELPFECDLTSAAKPGGENVLAIRVTNPFGRYDWVDGTNAQWGAVRLYRSHGFGGLDRGMVLSAHAGTVRIRDSWVLNDLDLGRVYCRTVTEVMNGVQPTGYLQHEVLGVGGTVMHTMKTERGPLQNKVLENNAGLFLPKVAAWDLESPNLYQLRTTWIGDDGSRDQRTINFGFRTFAVTGLGTDAMFRLNGRRMKLYSSISWGFWGLNGIWPTPSLAVKEVTQAKKLGLNCLNFHRNLAKEDVLRAHDTLGLLRYMEPGGGKLAIGKLPDGVAANAANIVMEKPTNAADKFAQRYMFVKCVEMVKAFRSHPSVIVYCLQNEIGADLKNPDTLAVLSAMRAEDPSRCIVLNDGFVAPPRKAAQAWYAPWDPHLHRSDEEEWGGWWNQHQGAGDQWYDEFYKSPTDYTYKAPWKKVLTEFGEMEGCATPDNRSLMLHQQDAGIDGQPAGKSYDHVDHAEILAAYDKWIDRWGFRKAFPATESLWLSLGKKCYDTWQNYMENARISDELDFAVISGWESTSIENHSGIVDNLRNFKSAPGPISGTLLPVRAIAKQRSLCTAWGDAAVFDLYFLNDTSNPVAGEIVFSVVDPEGHRSEIFRSPVPAQVADQFSYLIKEGVSFTPRRNANVPFGFEGMYRFKCELTAVPLATQTKDIWMTFVHFKALAGEHRVGVSGISPALGKQLRGMEFVQVEEFRLGEKYDLIISSGITSKVSTKQESGDTTGLEAQPGAAKVVPGRKLEPGESAEMPQTGHLQQGILEAVRAGTPLLAIPQADALSDGVARQLADAGAFTFSGNVGDFRAPWMGNWYFVREHPLYAGMPVNQAMGIHYAAKGRQSNGLLVEGPGVEIVVGYSRDHDRRIGAGTFTCKLGGTKVVYQRVPELHPVLQERFLANAIQWLTS